MSELHDWQSALQQSILERTNAIEIRALPQGMKQDQRLLIYQDAYLLRLMEALSVNYPCLLRVLGEALLGQIMLDFLAACPPKSASIRWFGEGLDRFLAKHPLSAARPELSEMASFEWAIRHTLDAADLEPLSMDQFRSIAVDDWPHQRLCLHPSVTSLDLHFNVPKIHHALEAGTTPPAVEADPAHWILYRDAAGHTRWRSLKDSEKRLIDGLKGGVAFHALLAKVEGQDDAEIIARFARLLGSFISDGLLILLKESAS